MACIDQLRRESGMTIIELLVSAAICAVGIAATIGLMDNSRQASIKSERRDVIAHQAERELERLMALPWTNLQHSGPPQSVASPPGNPSTYIAAGSYKYDRANPAASEPLVYSLTNGKVEPTPTAWNDGQGRLNGWVYRYVTNKEENARRVTVIVIANGANSPAPVLMSSIKTRPKL